MSRDHRSPRLLVRLVASHILLTAFVAVGSCASIVGLFYLVEDRVYESIVESALTASPKPLVVWDVDKAPAEFATLAKHQPDGVREVDSGGDEFHVGILTLPSGERRMAVLESDEIGPDRSLALGLAGGYLALSILAIVVGVLVARRTLAPLELLASKLAPDRPPPSPDEWRSGAGDDEVGAIARQLASFVEEREAALQREHVFLRDASHELRNPLTVLHGAVALLRETGTGGATAFSDRLDRMDRSVTRMRRTVDCLLTLARQESAAAALAGRPLDQSVAELVHETHSLAGEEVEVHCTFDASPPGAAELWIVIIRNLLENAVSATRAGSIHLMISAEEVRVEDTGHGMSSELLESVSQPFVGGAGSSGFGLGLAIVHRLADRLDWSVRTESSPAGTVVSLIPQLRTGLAPASSRSHQARSNEPWEDPLGQS